MPFASVFTAALLHIDSAAVVREYELETLLSELEKLPVRKRGTAHDVTLSSLSTFLDCAPSVAKSRASRQQFVDALMKNRHHGHSTPADSISQGEAVRDPGRDGADSKSVQAVSVQSLAAVLQDGRPCAGLKEKLNKVPVSGQASLLSLVRPVGAPVASGTTRMSDLVLALLYFHWAAVARNSAVRTGKATSQKTWHGAWCDFVVAVYIFGLRPVSCQKQSLKNRHHGHSTPADSISQGEAVRDPGRDGADSKSVQAVSVQSLAAVLQDGRPCAGLKEKLNKGPVSGQASLLSLVSTVGAPVASKPTGKSDLVLALLHFHWAAVVREGEL